ncbi:MAG TPA: ATP-dependent helicase HrpB [Candidatus Dormibacteraeota bacterium]|nr:ATP-dependent helicase HrpB [Candidatus Dormibacteraeota bacterium]
MPESLPIDPLLPQITAALRGGNRAVLRAAPGAGKTTRVPAALLDAGLGGDKQVVVLEPRRIAARAAAEYVAAQRGGAAGGEVGYRVRFESRGGARTRLWFVTEGVLGRQLARDPYLEDVGILVLDEFHERHLPGDVALALARELQETVRPDLKLVVMSATLDTAALATYLGGAPVLTSEGRAFPVRIEHADADPRPLAARVAAALARLLAGDDDGGDVLVFLPGAAAIRRVTEAIAPLAAARGLDVVPLHGDLPLDAQRRALQRGARRRVVLSTNVAETSLTVAGVTTVLDSGQALHAEYDARRGLNTIRLAPISRAAAEQRAGRAGRTAPGRCLRLWPAAEHASRLPRETPEIRRLELSATILELRAWGARDVMAVGWLDAPRAGAVEQAERLLGALGAVDDTGAVTDIGRELLTIAAPPRLGRLLVEARRRAVGDGGALLAALAAERDILLEARAFGAGDAPWPEGPSDLLMRAGLFAEVERAGFSPSVCRRLGLDAVALRAVDRARRQYASGGQRARSAAARGGADAALLKAVLAAFPDRLCRRRAPGANRALMVGGTGVALEPRSVVRGAELFVAVDLDAGAGADARVRIASAVERAWLAELFPDALHRQDVVAFDDDQQRVVRRERQLFHDLVLGERVSPDVDRATAGAALAAAARRDPAAAVGLDDDARHLLDRLRFLARAMPDLALPDVDALLADAVEALCDGKRSFAELRRGDVGGVLLGLLTGAQRHALERDAPARLTLPSGRSVAIAYAADKPPAAAARIQEVFGLAATPRLAGGRVPLVLELLAPNQRPVQITDDLASFWRRGYAEVRKQLRGRYPKHAWPDDPTTAEPTARARRR